MSSYTNIFGGGVINNSNNSYIALTLTGNITLSWVTQFQDINTVVYDIMDIVSNGSFSITMPDATQTSVGQNVLFTNVGGSNSFSVLDNTGSNIFTLAAGNARFLYLTANSTSAGTWRSVPYASGTPSVTSVAATSSSSNLTIGGSPITSAGTFTFGLANDLASLTGFVNLTGIAARTAANTWGLVTITGTANQITVTNGNGVAGAPTISLPSTITGINSLTVGNLTFNANTINTTNGGGVIIGDNVLQITENVKFMAGDNVHYNEFISGNQAFNLTYIWPTVAPTLDQVLQFGTGSQLQWTSITTFGGPSTVNAIAKYTDTAGSLGNSGVLIDGSNNVTGANSITIQNVQIGVSDGNTISSSSSNLKLIPNGTNQVQIGINSGTPNDLALMNGGSLRFMEPSASGTNYSEFFQPALSNNIQYSLPSIAPQVGSLMRIVGLTPSITPDIVWDNSDDNDNFLINGSMSIWQRAISFTNSTFFPNNNNVYIVDYWKLQSPANNVVNVSRDIGPQNLICSSPYSVKFTVTTPNLKFGIVQFLDNQDTLRVSGFITSIGFSAMATGISNLRCALIQWAGAADSPTSNIVSSWNAAGVNPTLAANWSYSALATGSIVNIPITNAWATYTVNPDGLHYYNPTTGANNLAVFIWVDDTTAAVNATLNISGVKFEQGRFSTRFVAHEFEEELFLCSRLFNKDLPYAIEVGRTLYPPTPAVPITTATQCYWISANVTAGNPYARVNFFSSMRTTPTFVTYPYTTTTNTSICSNSAGVDLAAASASTYALDSKGAIVYTTTNINNGGTNVFIFHWYADAGF